MALSPPLPKELVPLVSGQERPSVCTPLPWAQHWLRTSSQNLVRATASAPTRCPHVQNTHGSGLKDPRTSTPFQGLKGQEEAHSGNKGPPWP